MKKSTKRLKQLSLFLSLYSIELKTRMPAKPKKEFTNDEIFYGILHENTEVFRYIRFYTFPTLVKWVKLHKGSKNEASQLFQDALIVVFRKLKKGPLELNCKFNTYFLGVCKTILKYSYRNGNTIVLEVVDVVDDEQEIEDLYKESKEFQLYRKYFNRLNKCHQDILNASLSNKPYRELFLEFGFKNVDVFKSKIYQVKRNLIEKITSDPDFEKYNGGKGWSL